MPGPPRRFVAVSFIIKSRTDRKKYLPSRLFSEPAWDMLLNLYAAAIEKRSVGISALCVAANVGRSTADRWIAALEHDDLIVRTKGRGADSVALSEKGWFAMDSYFEGMSSGKI
jgi:predicted transcriptional regulator